MTKIKLGDKVIRDAATVNQGKVHLGDLRSLLLRAIRAGDKVVARYRDRERGQSAPRGLGSRCSSALATK